MLSNEDIAAEAKPMRLRVYRRDWPSVDWELTKYIKSETASTWFPSTDIVWGWGPDPRFWVLVFGHETWRPNTDAVSAKLERHVAAEAGDSTKKAVSSAYTQSVTRSRPAVIPGLDFMCLNIQSIATQKSARARTQLCLTPEVVKSGSDSCFPRRTRTEVFSWNAMMRSSRTSGIPRPHRAFQRASLSTESKTALISRYTTFRG